MRWSFFSILIFLISCQVNTSTTAHKPLDKKVYPSRGHIEKLHPSLDKIISTEAVIEQIGEGLKLFKTE